MILMDVYVGVWECQNVGVWMCGTVRLGVWGSAGGREEVWDSPGRPVADRASLEEAPLAVPLPQGTHVVGP